jgi:hypothetical protein
VKTMRFDLFSVDGLLFFNKSGVGGRLLIPLSLVGCFLFIFISVSFSSLWFFVSKSLRNLSSALGASTGGLVGFNKLVASLFLFLFVRNIVGLFPYVSS